MIRYTTWGTGNSVPADEVIRVLAVAQPGQFQLMRAAAVFQIDDDERTGLDIDPPDSLHNENRKWDPAVF